MRDGSWYVSTPRWTCRLDVVQGTIQPTSARYLWRSYGQPFLPTLRRWQQMYGRECRAVRLKDVAWGDWRSPRESIALHIREP